MAAGAVRAVVEQEVDVIIDDGTGGFGVAVARGAVSKRFSATVDDRPKIARIAKETNASINVKPPLRGSRDRREKARGKAFVSSAAGRAAVRRKVNGENNFIRHSVEHDPCPR